jgi:hypothetical protein
MLHLVFRLITPHGSFWGSRRISVALSSSPEASTANADVSFVVPTQLTKINIDQELTRRAA